MVRHSWTAPLSRPHPLPHTGRTSIVDDDDESQEPVFDGSHMQVVRLNTNYSHLDSATVYAEGGQLLQLGIRAPSTYRNFYRDRLMQGGHTNHHNHLAKNGYSFDVGGSGGLWGSRIHSIGEHAHAAPLAPAHGTSSGEASFRAGEVYSRATLNGNVAERKPESSSGKKQLTAKEIMEQDHERLRMQRLHASYSRRLVVPGPYRSGHDVVSGPPYGIGSSTTSASGMGPMATWAELQRKLGIESKPKKKHKKVGRSNGPALDNQGLSDRGRNQRQRRLTQIYEPFVRMVQLLEGDSGRFSSEASSSDEEDGEWMVADEGESNSSQSEDEEYVHGTPEDRIAPSFTMIEYEEKSHDGGGQGSDEAGSSYVTESAYVWGPRYGFNSNIHLNQLQGLNHVTRNSEGIIEHDSIDDELEHSDGIEVNMNKPDEEGDVVEAEAIAAAAVLSLTVPSTTESSSSDGTVTGGSTTNVNTTPAESNESIATLEPTSTDARSNAQDPGLLRSVLHQTRDGRRTVFEGLGSLIMGSRRDPGGSSASTATTMMNTPTTPNSDISLGSAIIASAISSTNPDSGPLYIFSDSIDGDGSNDESNEVEKEVRNHKVRWNPDMGWFGNRMVDVTGGSNEYSMVSDSDDDDDEVVVDDDRKNKPDPSYPYEYIAPPSKRHVFSFAADGEKDGQRVRIVTRQYEPNGGTNQHGHGKGKSVAFASYINDDSDEWKLRETVDQYYFLRRGGANTVMNKWVVNGTERQRRYENNVFVNKDPRDPFKQKLKFDQSFWTTDSWEVFHCKKCKTDISTTNDIISKAFQGQSGKAYLFERASNIKTGKTEDRVMTTGKHKVTDVHCRVCSTYIGWRYDIAYENSQKYKEGKYILERTHMDKYAVLNLDEFII